MGKNTKEPIVIETEMSFNNAIQILNSECSNYDDVMAAWIVVDHAIKVFKGIADKAVPFLNDVDSFAKFHEVDDDIVYKVGDVSYKTHALISDSIELDKSLLDETTLPSNFFDRSPRLSHKMVKDAYKNGDTFGNIQAACQVVTNKTMKTFEVDPTTFKKTVKKEV